MEEPKREPLNPAISKFCMNLLSQKGMDDMPEEIKANMLMDLYSRFEQWLFLSVMQELDKDQLDKFDDFLAEQEDKENPDPQETENFLMEQVPNYEEVLKRAMEDFSRTYLGE